MTQGVYLNMDATKSAEKLYMHLNASELSAIIMKGSPHSNDRDAGFCSGSSEGGDDISIDHSRLEPCSPTNASEDSVEVKLTPMCLVRNKRKSTEPLKVISERDETIAATGPLKKRIRYTSSADSGVVLTPPTITITTPPPPPPAAQPLWDPSQVLPHELMPNPAQVFLRHPGVTTLHRLPLPSNNIEDVQEEPLALVFKKPTPNSNEIPAIPIPTTIQNSKNSNKSPTKTAALKISQRDTSVTPSNKNSQTTKSSSSNTIETKASVEASKNDNFSVPSTSAAAGIAANGKTAARPQQRNYKNMTRERRIEANARERTRVHTISAAYETLRRAVPSYSNSQKLSKLSVLRVACSYILCLSRMAGEDYTEDQSEPSIASCFDAVTSTIQTEGKIRKKKDE